MKSCRSALSVLLLLTITTVAESAHTSVKVKLRDSAVLPCSERCSGVVRWTLYSVSGTPDVLAECDQTSCRSVKEGYQMIHDQYLKGDLSLTITGADFSKRGWYTCECDGTDLCDVQLLIETLNTTVQKNVGESLELQLYVSDDVEVVYNSTDAAGPSNVQICRVGRHSVEFRREYTQRASVSPDLTLKEMKVSDSGVYTVRDTETKEVICIYTVSVYDDSETKDQKQKASDPHSDASDQGAALPGWVVPVLLLMVAVCVVSVGFNVWQWRKIQLQKGSVKNGYASKNSFQMTEQSNSGPKEQNTLLPPSNDPELG